MRPLEALPLVSVPAREVSNAKKTATKVRCCGDWVLSGVVSSCWGGRPLSKLSAVCEATGWTWALEEMTRVVWCKRASCAHRNFPVVIDTGRHNDLGIPKQKTKEQAEG